MAKLRLSIELYDVVNANGAQATDEALDRRTVRTIETIEQQVEALLQRRQFTVSWARMPEPEEPIYHETVEWVEGNPTVLSPTRSVDPVPNLDVDQAAS